jgi:glycosyltransferase involved in cell wall biosynthesis
MTEELQQLKRVKPLLTIAIPTYNRAECLKLLLSELIKQITDDRVELIISDNASTDGTSEVVEQFVRQGTNIRYKANAVNIGSDANFLQCYSMARGEYVWIFGDDDVIVPDGLEKVLSVVEKREFDLIYVSSYGFRGQYVPAVQMLGGRLIEIDNATDFALRVATSLTFISGNIARKEKVEAMAHFNFSELVGTNLVQLSWIVTLLSDNPKCAILLDRLVAVKSDNTGGHGTCKVFGENLKTIVQRFLGVDTEIGRAILHRTVQSWFPWAIVQGRSTKNSSHDPEVPEEILGKLYGANFRYWLFLWPVLKLPLPFAKFWLLIVKATNRLDQVLGYPIAR